MERVADYVVRKVNEAGAGYIFLVTGRGILYLTDAVAKNGNIKHISTYHEQGASYAAMAYSSAFGSIGACLVSTGCAATNAATACLCAYQDNLPVVFLSGNNHLKENTRHTGLPIRTYGSQETDIIKIVESCTKYAVMLEDKDTIVFEVEKALYIMQEGRKGPVWIDVPLDVQNMRIDEADYEHFQAFDTVVQNEMLDKEAKEVAEEINRAKRPLLLIGGGTRGCESLLTSFVENHGIPVTFSPSATDVYGAFHELSIGAVGSLGGTRAGNFSVQNADYILAVGTKLCSQETGMKHAFAREAKITVVDIDEKEHLKDGVPIERIIHSDAGEFLNRLLRQEIKQTNDEWSEKCKHWKDAFSIDKEAFIKELTQKNELDIYSFADIISDVLPPDATVITDAGFEELIIPSAIRYKNGQRCLFPAAQGVMGYAIPAIIGAYEARRKNIICVVGDGSFMMNIQELQIISALQIPVIIFVISNNMYAVIRKRQTDLFRNRTIGNDPSDGVPKPDFRKIADCFGFVYKKIQNRMELKDGIEKLIQSGGLRMVEVVCTPEQKYLHESYGVNENRKLVHRPIEDMAPFLERDVVRNEMIVHMMEE